MISCVKADGQTGSKEEKNGDKKMNDKKNVGNMFFNRASLCFGQTETLLCEARHPAGLSEIVRFYRYENDKESK
jgi:hypothetical protein